MKEVNTVLEAIASAGAHVIRLDDVRRHPVRPADSDDLNTLFGGTVPAGAYTVAKFEVLIPTADQP